jgi:hypothetical protein
MKAAQFGRRMLLSGDLRSIEVVAAVESEEGGKADDR